MEGNCMKLKEKVFKGVDNYYYAFVYYALRTRYSARINDFIMLNYLGQYSPTRSWSSG